jgi:hypothetical protein
MFNKHKQHSFPVLFKQNEMKFNEMKRYGTKQTKRINHFDEWMQAIKMIFLRFEIYIRIIALKHISCTQMDLI